MAPSEGGRLRAAAMIKVQHTAEALTADDRARRNSELVGGINDLVFEPLMISFAVIMHDIRADRVSQLLLAEKDHSVQALGFNTSHESFDVRVKVWRSRGQEQGFGSRIFERGPKRFGEFRVAVHQDLFAILPFTERGTGTFCSMTPQNQPVPTSSPASVKFRAICCIQAPSGETVQPANSMRQVLRWIANRK